VESISDRSFDVREDGIYYLVLNRTDGGKSLRFQSFATGKNVEIAPINVGIATSKQAPAHGMSVSPDQKTILFAVAVRSGSNAMVVDNFR
jgi:hypothetical protein